MPSWSSDNEPRTARITFRIFYKILYQRSAREWKSSAYVSQLSPFGENFIIYGRLGKGFANKNKLSVLLFLQKTNCANSLGERTGLEELCEPHKDDAETQLRIYIEFWTIRRRYGSAVLKGKIVLHELVKVEIWVNLNYRCHRSLVTHRVNQVRRYAIRQLRPTRVRINRWRFADVGRRPGHNVYQPSVSIDWILIRFVGFWENFILSSAIVINEVKFWAIENG